MANSKVYFPNLNALRFIAALLVIFAHTELTKNTFGLPNYIHIPAIIVGHVAVVLFFVLSGFLITYLLLTEDATYDKINIRQFYLRRILRIWPLYYLTVILGLFILPHLPLFSVPAFTPAYLGEHFSMKVWMYMLFLPNLVYALLAYVPYLSHCWSIGTEEHFYLAWPWLTKLFRHGNKAYIFLLIVLVHILIRSTNVLFPPDVLTDRLYQFWSLLSIQVMAIGGFFAYIIFRKRERYIRFFFHPVVFGAAVLGSIVCILIGFEFPHFDNEFYAILFGIIIVNLACNGKIGGIMEHKVLNYLGKISYGLYMYHGFIIIAVINILPTAYKANNLILYPLVIIGTIIISSLSYHLIEAGFINFKQRFAKIVSGDKAREEKK